jgi:hypothetical protein
MNSIDLLSEKYKNACEIIEDLESIIYFLHDDIERIVASRWGRPLSWDAYSYSVDVTRRQLTNKQHLDGVKRFIQLEAAPALRWLVARLTNNAINHYRSFKDHKIADEDLWYEESLVHDLIDIDTIKDRSPEIFHEVFVRLSRDALFGFDDFDLYDFEYLCAKYGLDLSEYTLSPFAITAEIAASGGAQLLFGFDEIEKNLRNENIKE